MAKWGPSSETNAKDAEVVPKMKGQFRPIRHSGPKRTTQGHIVTKSRRRGMSLLEIVFVTAIAAVPVIVIMSLIGSNTENTAHNRSRIIAQMVLTNMVSRFASIPDTMLGSVFGDGDGGADAIYEDEILNAPDAWSSEELKKLGIKRDCFFYRTSDDNFSGVLMMVVSYKDRNGNERRLTQERMCGARGFVKGARAIGGKVGRTTFRGPAGGSTYRRNPSRSTWQTSQQGEGARAIAKRRYAGSSSATEIYQSGIQVKLVNHLEQVDRRDGSADYSWSEISNPSEDRSAFDTAVDLVQRRPIPDGSYQFTWETLDYRELDRRFGMPEETFDVVLFTLTDIKTDSTYIMMLERHGDVRKKAPKLQLLNGEMVRSEGLHKMTVKDKIVDAWVSVTPTKLFIARPAVSPSGRVFHYTNELLVRSFKKPWTLEEQQKEESRRGKKVDLLGERLALWYEALKIDGQGKFPGKNDVQHPFGF